MPEESVVTPEMLRWIATKAMGLDPNNEKTGCWYVMNPGDWFAGGELVFRHTPNVDYDWSFRGDFADVDASELLMWLVRLKGWHINWLWSDPRRSLCYVQARSWDDECRGHAPTLCEAIISAVLAASGWKDEGDTDA